MSKSITRPSVTFCINELDVGGAEKALVRIAKGLHQRGWRVAVISLRDRGPLADELEASGIFVVALGSGGFADLQSPIMLRVLLESEDTDIIVSFLHQANIHTRLAARRLGVPVVSGIRVADRRRWVTWTDWLTSRWVTKYVAVSQSVAETHARLCGLAPKRIIAIPNGVDLPEHDVLSPHRPDDRLLVVGRLTRQKAPLSVVEAFSRLPDDLRLKSQLTFVGEGELKSATQEAVRKMGLSHQIQFAGHVSNVEQRMQTATALVLASAWEGLPNVVLEAMANGLPVIATAVDGTTELIEGGKSGWLVKPGHPDALASAMRECLERPDLRQRYAQAAQNTARAHFSWESVVDRYEQLLRSLLTPSNGPTDAEM
ncbi:MAG: glycosyltransferase [Planctomycetaceae bacterium]|nr:glycosyltransferase [Planctomycetaceae bacterium]